MRNFQAKRLELVLAEAGVGEPHPEDDEADDHHLPEQHERADDVHVVGVEVEAGQVPPAEEQRGGDGGEGAGRGELADEEQQEPEARVLGHVAGDDLGLGDRHVERRLGQLGLHGDR